MKMKASPVYIWQTSITEKINVQTAARLRVARTGFFQNFFDSSKYVRADRVRILLRENHRAGVKKISLFSHIQVNKDGSTCDLRSVKSEKIILLSSQMPEVERNSWLLKAQHRTVHSFSMTGMGCQ